MEEEEGDEDEDKDREGEEDKGSTNGRAKMTLKEGGGKSYLSIFIANCNCRKYNI